MLQVLAVVNHPPGSNMARRADALREHLAPGIAFDVLAAPRMRTLLPRLRNSDLVYVIDPGRVGFPAAVAARVAGKRVVVEMGDAQAPLYRAAGRGAVAVAAGAAIDRLVVRYANAIVLRGRGLADTFTIRVPWTEIPDAVDTELFRPDVDGDLRGRLGIPAEALVVGLVGSLHGETDSALVYGWDIVEALALVEHLPIWGLVVGGGSGLERLRVRARRLGVEGRLVLPGERPHSEMPAYIAAMDVCVSTQTNDPIGRGRTTAKLPEYLAADRFVLATAVGAAADVLPAEMLLAFEGSCDSAHPGRLAARLTELWARRAELRRGAGTRTIALELYGYDVIAPRLAAFLRQIAA